MQVTRQQQLIKHSFWLALLLHLFLLFGFSVTFFFPIKKRIEHGPELYTPAYVYHQNNVSRPVQEPHKAEQKTPPERKADTNANDKEVKTKALETSLASPRPQLSAVNMSKTSDPVHLIGDKNVKKPLLTLLGKAFSAHLIYPKIAIDFNVKGIVLVGFLLHPDGNITDAQVVRSSEAGVLDGAALNAVMGASPVGKVSQFIQQPQYLVVGVIFG